MKRAMLLVLLFVLPTVAGGGPSISVMDFVKVKNGKSAEAVFFYENNWRVYREVALKRGFIRSYQLLKTKEEAGTDFDLILITEYADAEQWKLSEERFSAIIKETNPGPVKLLNSVPPAEFRNLVFSKKVETLAEAGPR